MNTHRGPYVPHRTDAPFFSAYAPCFGGFLRHNPTQSHDHREMASEPHHVLAMAYHQNLASFARALHEQTMAADSLNLDFARAAVSEMRRSFDQMKQHHQEHMKGMSPDKHAKMTGMMEKTEARRTEMSTQLTDLEQELLSATPDAKKVSGLANRLHTRLAEMEKMHQGC